MSSSCKKCAGSFTKLVIISLALQESTLEPCFPSPANQSCLHLSAVLPTSKSAEGFISLPAFHPSVPLCQRCNFHLCFPSRSLGPVMLTVLSALCLLSHWGYLAPCSQHLPSTSQGMARGTQHYTKACVCPAPLGPW